MTAPEREFFTGIPPTREYLTGILATVGRRHPEILSIYVFGSVARGDATWRSDLDLLFLVREGTSRQVFRVLATDPDYQALEGEVLRRLEGGLGPVVTGPEEIFAAYDTLADRVSQEGWHVYGLSLVDALADVDRSKHAPASNWRELVESL